MDSKPLYIEVISKEHGEYYFNSYSIPRIGDKIRVYDWNADDFVIKDVIYKTYDHDTICEDVVLIVE